MIAGSPGIQTAAYSSMDEAKTIMEKFIGKTAEDIKGDLDNKTKSSLALL
jgi:hypothetical protein